MLLPIGHEETSLRRLPWVTFGIMALCVLAFLLSGRAAPPTESGTDKAAAEFTRYFLSHAYLKLDPRGMQLIFPGKSESSRSTLLETLKAASHPPEDPAVIRSEQEELDRLASAVEQAAASDRPGDTWALVPSHPTIVAFFTHMFLHAGWLHLLGNLFILYLTGPYLEDVWGRPLFAVIYLASGFVAAGVFVLRHTDSDVPLVGASGAIAGLMGAFLVRYAKTKIRFAYMFALSIRGTFEAPAWVMLPLWFLQQVFFALLTDSDSGGGVAYLAHVAEFGFGAAAAWSIASFDIEARWIRPRIEAKTTTTHISRPDLDRAMEARAAGDLPVALAILKAEAARVPNDRDVLLMLWDVALACGQAGEAAPSMLRAIRQELRSGEGALAAEHWIELEEHAPPGALEPPMALRLAQALDSAGQRKAAIGVLQNLIGSSMPRGEPGLSLKIARFAARLDLDLGSRAARSLLELPGLAPLEREEAERLGRECGGVPLRGD